MTKVAEDAGLTDADLTTPIRQSNLYKLAACVREDWPQLAVELEIHDQNDTAFQGLLKWHESQRSTTTHRDLTDVLWRSNKKQAVEKIFTLLHGMFYS